VVLVHVGQQSRGRGGRGGNHEPGGAHPFEYEPTGRGCAIPGAREWGPERGTPDSVRGCYRVRTVGNGAGR
jgi:hypothetical protein